MADQMFEIRRAIDGLVNAINKLAKKLTESNQHHAEEQKKLRERVTNLEQRNDGGGSS